MDCSGSQVYSLLALRISQRVAEPKVPVEAPPSGRGDQGMASTFLREVVEFQSRLDERKMRSCLVDRMR